MTWPKREDEVLTELEADLRATFGRAAGPVPISLRLRIAAIPDGTRPRAPWWARLTDEGLALAGGLAALVVVAVVLFRSVAGPAPVGVVASGPRGPEALEGVGILGSVAPLLQFVPPLFGLGLGVLLVAWARRRRRWIPAAVLAAVAAIWLGIGLASHSAVAVSGWGAQEGLVGLARDGQGGPGRIVLAVTARPGERFGLALLLRNPGPLPMRILGAVERGSESDLMPRWTGAGVLSDAPPGSMLGWDEAAPFEPFELPPGGVREIVLVGRASACALGSESGTASLGAPQIRIAYSVLWLTAEVAIDDIVVVQPVRMPCP